MADSNPKELSETEKLKEMAEFLEVDFSLLKSPLRLIVEIVYKIFTSLRNNHQL